MQIVILGRQPHLGLAELESRFSPTAVKTIDRQTAYVDTDELDIQTFGGILKAGEVFCEIRGHNFTDISSQLVERFTREFMHLDGKITLGISVYSRDVKPYEIQKIGLAIKNNLKKSGHSLRLVPNASAALSTAVSHHNKLGLSDNKIELLIIKSGDHFVVAKSTGSQNITAYARRDQARPKRDAFVGMLPPKLAQIMVNLALGDKAPTTLLDPFCGTGVVLQEAAIAGFDKVYGSDLSDKMILYSQENLDWLKDTHHINFDYELSSGDAMKLKWPQPIDFVVSETYLGQPFNTPPRSAKLAEVVDNCNHITLEFLQNLHRQITPKTSICIAVPAWRDRYGHFTHLPLIAHLEKLGYCRHQFTHVSNQDLLYYREDQVVARELLVLEKISR